MEKSFDGVLERTEAPHEEYNFGRHLQVFWRKMRRNRGGKGSGRVARPPLGGAARPVFHSDGLKNFCGSSS